MGHVPGLGVRSHNKNFRKVTLQSKRLGVLPSSNQGESYPVTTMSKFSGNSLLKGGS
jgi:hypothetical protein